MIKDLYRRGVSISEIARVTGHDRKTIRGEAQGPVIASPQVRQAKASKLESVTSPQCLYHSLC